MGGCSAHNVEKQAGSSVCTRERPRGIALREERRVCGRPRCKVNKHKAVTWSEVESSAIWRETLDRVRTPHPVLWRLLITQKPELVRVSLGWTTVVPLFRIPAASLVSLEQCQRTPLRWRSGGRSGRRFAKCTNTVSRTVCAATDLCVRVYVYI